MTTAGALGLQIARRVNDRLQQAIDPAGYLDFINMAHDDLYAAGWLQPQSEDSSTSLVNAVYDYVIPAGFAYIQHLYVADANGAYPMSYEIPPWHWRPALIAGVAYIRFWPDVADLIVTGRSMLILGQKRPPNNIDGETTIAEGFLSFVRERATSYAAESLAGGSDESAQQRQRLADSSWAKSNAAIGYQPMEFRVKPNSKLVPLQ